MGAEGAWREKLIEVGAILLVILIFFALWFISRMLAIPAEMRAADAAAAAGLKTELARLAASPERDLVL
jgi:hypothetical protein